MRPRPALCSVPEDRLQLEELGEAGFAPLAAVAGLSVAPERAAEVGLGAVHVDVPGADALRNPPGALDVARGDVAREPVRRVVRDPHGVVLVLVRDDRE